MLLAALISPWALTGRHLLKYSGANYIELVKEGGPIRAKYDIRKESYPTERSARGV